MRLTAVAPQAFPQRAILPHRGATMSARPWIRAATGGGSPGHSGAAGRLARAPWSTPARDGPPAERRRCGAPARVAPASPYSSYASPHVYNPARPVAPSARASNQPAFASTAPRIYNPPGANGAPHIYNPAPAGNGAHIYNPPAAEPRAAHLQPGAREPRAAHLRPAGDVRRAAHVRRVAGAGLQSAAALVPELAGREPVAHVRPARPARARAPGAPDVRAPACARDGAPSHGFSAPAGSGWSGHAAGGGAQFGGGHRR